MLKTYKPEVRDLWFREQMMADEETMSYNHHWGGTIPFPEECWKDWHEAWVSDDKDCYYRYVADESGTFVGEIAYHLDEGINAHVADVIIYAPCRGQGNGSEALELLCQAARKNGVRVLYDNIAIDNPAIRMFLKHGFHEESRNDEVIWLRKDL
ncbi:MAG: GNAT family N-acetyltransferase [Erysipelotrichaceae bacterium]|nr:GNAT family N-acetyltransferase [Erysipelotrichaceae bacterium]